MKGQPQGSNEIVIEAAAEQVWAVLQDATRLPDWAPMVLKTTGTREAMGAVRECEVNLEGRSGRVCERCVTFEPFTRIGWELVHDTLGFSRLLGEFGFDFVLEPLGQAETRVRNSTYYTPRGVLGSLMSVLVLRRKFAAIRSRMLANLKQISEGRPASVSSASAALS